MFVCIFYQVLLARQLYFNYTTPDRSRQELLRTKTPLPKERWPFMRYVIQNAIFSFHRFLYLKARSFFITSSKGDGKGIWISSPLTPKAPKHGPRPPRLHKVDFRPTAAVLFQDTTFPSKCVVPPGLPRPVVKPVASTRVLFYEDELCQAVAQNKLLWEKYSALLFTYLIYILYIS